MNTQTTAWWNYYGSGVKLYEDDACNNEIPANTITCAGLTFANTQRTSGSSHSCTSGQTGLMSNSGSWCNANQCALYFEVRHLASPHNERYTIFLHTIERAALRRHTLYRYTIWTIESLQVPERGTPSTVTP